MDAVLFDLDGTLLDHAHSSTAAIAATLPDADPDVLAPRWAALTDQGMDRFLSGEWTFPQQRRWRITTLRAELGLPPLDDTAYDTWLAAYVHAYEAAWRAFPDVTPALAALSGARLGVITNGDTFQQRAKLAALGLTPALPYVLTSHEFGRAKPDPAIFHAACDALALPPHRVAYVGDRLDTDARGATAAGLHGIWLDRPALGQEADDVPRITDLRALLTLLSATPPESPA